MLPFLLNDVTASTSLSMPSSLLPSGFVYLWIQISQNGVCKTGRLTSSLWALCIYSTLLLWAEITGHFAKFVKSLYWLLAWLNASQSSDCVTTRVDIKCLFPSQMAWPMSSLHSNTQVLPCQESFSPSADSDLFFLKLGVTYCFIWHLSEKVFVFYY